MMKNFGALFQPLTIKNMQLKNRVVMTPMGTNYAKSSGEISSEHIEYYLQRAKGGTGLIIVENICVDFPVGSNGTTQLRIDKDHFIPGLAELCEKVHQYGTSIAVQINHAGASAIESRIGCQPGSASDIPSKRTGQIPRPFTVEELKDIVIQYGQAAKRAKIAGFDAVEIHGGHSYLLSQFLSPLTNKRQDEFGGSPENRARLTTMVVKEVLRQVGPMYPIMIRLSADEFLEGGNTLEDTLTYIQYFEKDIDIFDVSAGLNDSNQYQIDASYLQDGWRSYMAKAVKDKYRKICMTTGNIRNPEIANKIILDGEVDLIGLGRGLIAEQEWANKAKAGQVEEIRKCISCNVGCVGNRLLLNKPIRCTVNPGIIFGDGYKKKKVKHPCNVVVIGGGTAGLEAACTAAEVGCAVFLLEKNSHLGGLSVEISKIPDKKRLADFPNYLINRAQKLKNLFILTGEDVDIRKVQQYNPDIIVNATGSRPLLPPIKGLAENIDRPAGRVFSITELINRLDSFQEDMAGQRVVVIGGGAVGLDVVEFFAPKNAQISIVEMAAAIGAGIDPVSMTGSLAVMKKYKVEQLVSTKLLEVKAQEFIVSDSNGETKVLPFDYGFVCLGMKAENPLLEPLLNEFTNIPVINIGDSKRARRIIEGVQEGRDILLHLEQAGYL